MRLAPLAVLLLALALAPGAAAQNAGLDQYVESLPDAAGNGPGKNGGGSNATAGAAALGRGVKGTAENGRAGAGKDGKNSARKTKKGDKSDAGIASADRGDTGDPSAASAAADTFLGGAGSGLLIAIVVIASLIAAVAVTRKVRQTARQQS